MEEEQPDWLPVTGMRFQNGEPINGVPLFPFPPPAHFRARKVEEDDGWREKMETDVGPQSSFERETSRRLLSSPGRAANRLTFSFSTPLVYSFARAIEWTRREKRWNGRPFHSTHCLSLLSLSRARDERSEREDGWKR